jgi:hypothetical protein
MRDIHIFPQGQGWEISNSAVSDGELLFQEVVTGMTAVFYSRYASTPEQITKTQASDSAKIQAVTSAISLASSEIQNYQRSEPGRSSRELLSKAYAEGIEVSGSDILVHLTVINQAGESVTLKISL